MVLDLVVIVILSLITQQFVDTIKKAVKFNKGYAYIDKKVNLKVVIAIIVSIVLCVASDVNIFELLGIEMMIPHIGEIITGVLVSNGASSVQNLIEKITEIKGGAN